MSQQDRPKRLTPTQMHALDLLRSSSQAIRVGNRTGYKTGHPTIAAGSAAKLAELGLVAIDESGRVTLTQAGCAA